LKKIENLFYRLHQTDFQFSSGRLLKFVSVAIDTLKFMIRKFRGRVFGRSTHCKTCGNFRLKRELRDYNEMR